MTEKQTFTTAQPNASEGISEEYFAPIQEIQNNHREDNVDREDNVAEVAGDPFTSQAAERARSMSMTEKAVAVGAGAALAAGAIIGGPEIVDRFNGPEFSEETTTYTVQPGDGLQNAAEAVQGSENVDIRDVIHHISVDPANIDALSDGLQPGESIVIPVSVEK